jgi:hypothetical protein
MHGIIAPVVNIMFLFVPMIIFVPSAPVSNFYQRVIDRTLKILSIENHLVVKSKNRRLTAFNMPDVAVSSFAEDVQKDN